MKNSVTKEGIEGKIAKREFHVIPSTTLTICILTLSNGFSVRGESACVDPANFNREKGEQYAYEDAFSKIWALEGYLLKQRLHELGVLTGETNVAFGTAITALKLGAKVSRAGWNGKGMYLELQTPDAHSKMSLPYIYMKTADNNFVPWLASQTDVLASDWTILN